MHSPIDLWGYRRFFRILNVRTGGGAKRGLSDNCKLRKFLILFADLNAWQKSSFRGFMDNICLFMRLEHLMVRRG